MYNVASAAEAAVDFSLLTARLEATPFQKRVAVRVFPQTLFGPSRNNSPASTA
jgi:hypothetical protein